MIKKEIYSVDSFMKILEKNKIDCEFERCVLFPDYVVYAFNLKKEHSLTEFQLYSVTFSVLVESESSCYFIGKNGSKLLFLLTFTNDLKKYGLSKTKEKRGDIPKEEYEFDYVKKSLENLIWYKFDTKNLKENRPIKDFLENGNEEEKEELQEIWNDILN